MYHESPPLRRIIFPVSLKYYSGTYIRELENITPSIIDSDKIKFVLNWFESYLHLFISNEDSSIRIIFDRKDIPKENNNKDFNSVFDFLTIDEEITSTFFDNVIFKSVYFNIENQKITNFSELISKRQDVKMDFVFFNVIKLPTN